MDKNKCVEVLKIIGWNLQHTTNCDCEKCKALQFVIDNLQEQPNGHSLPCKHLAFKTLNGRITELFIEGEEFVRKEQPREYCQCEKPYPSKVRCAICGKNIKPHSSQSKLEKAREILEKLNRWQITRNDKGDTHAEPFGIDQALTALTPLFEPLERLDEGIEEILLNEFKTCSHPRSYICAGCEKPIKVAHAICEKFGRIKGKVDVKRIIKIIVSISIKNEVVDIKGGQRDYCTVPVNELAQTIATELEKDNV